ncbi:hypothetical protein DB30_07995 [Enhygromyxa salina]|uniref:Uncharacterized protein n=1 Tax=Enhygromyxa salina TaxID=215803 RepID=A0A0C1ZR52_9BACT|nr:hypothetical protein DB30_07995 [Enhygromyxa salina]
MIDCATQLAPEVRDEYVAIFGVGGSCWGADPKQWAGCRDACRQTLDTLNMVAELTGESCGTCQSALDCGPGATCAGGYCIGSQSNAGEAGSEDQGGDGDGDPVVEIEAVSLLLVVDNSGQMGPAQRVLADHAYELVAPLEAAGIPWRLGITTTDSGNPWCPPGATTPELGSLVFSICKARIGNFFFNNGQTDLSDELCYDICQVPDVGTNPTKTASDPTPRSRPWIESAGDGTNNLSGDPALPDLLACVVPQGINGCGFESQLESARRALVRSRDPEDDQYGFVEDGRLLAIVFVSEEADCSSNRTFDSIFEVDGNRVFWSDPDTAFPSSAVCWNAGVECVGDPSGYDTCVPADYDVDGDKTSDPDLAVMLPVQGFIDAYSAGGPVVTFGILGVGADGQPSYANTNSEDQDYRGIDVACTGSNAVGEIRGVPPVRMWSVVQELGPQSDQAVYSICSSDFGGGLGQIGSTIAGYF